MGGRRHSETMILTLLILVSVVALAAHLRAARDLDDRAPHNW